MTRRQVIGAATIASAAAIAGLGQMSPPVRAATRAAVHGPSPLQGLRAGLRGRLLEPGDRGYRSLSTPSNGRFGNIRPQAVAVVAGAEDVAHCVRWCREHDVPFVVRGGGHNYAGYSTTTGLVISTASLTGLGYQAPTGRLRAGSGILNRELYSLLPQQGQGRWVLPLGTCPGVGIAGLVLGGGIGPSAPWAGLAVDALRSTTLVNAEGEIVKASEAREPELFWAIRGAGGGNFGIHTDFTFQMVPVPTPMVTTFIVRSVGRDSCTAALVAFQRLRIAHPRTVTGIATTEVDPSGAIAGEVRGQVIGDEALARDLLAPLLGVAGLDVVITERPWWEAFAGWLAQVPAPGSWWVRSRYAYDAIPDDALGRQVDHLAAFPGPTTQRKASFLLMGEVGGAVDDVARTDSAYVHRGASAIARYNVNWPMPGASTCGPGRIPSDIREWVDVGWDELSGVTAAESYQNFPDRALTDWADAYYRENLPRLIAAKRRYDPDNVFTYGQSVPLRE